MAVTYMPGSAYTVTVGAGDTTIGVTANTADVTYGPSELAKPVLGAEATGVIAGQGSGTFNCGGHATEENIADLWALIEIAAQAVAIEYTYNATGDKVAFNGVGSVTTTATGDGEVDWTFSGSVDGKPAFTPGT